MMDLVVDTQSGPLLTVLLQGVLVMRLRPIVYLPWSDPANDDTINGLPSSEKCFAKNASFISLEIFLLFAYERLLKRVSHLMNSLRTVLD
jgi:hypothetical protein